MKKPAWLVGTVIPALAVLQGVKKTQVFLLGTQRSGTTLLTDVLGRAPLCRAYHEADEQVMRDMRLREPAAVEKVIDSECRPILVFKPINDSQYATELLDTYANPKVVWIYRDYNDVVNSALVKWAHWQRQIVTWVCEHYADEPGPLDEPFKWYAIYRERMSRATLQAVSACIEEGITDAEGAALLWYMRNKLYFDQQLREHDKCLIARYEDMVSRPEVHIARIFDFIGCAFKNDYVGDVRTTSISRKQPPMLGQSVRELCDGLQSELDNAYEQQSGAYL